MLTSHFLHDNLLVQRPSCGLALMYKKMDLKLFIGYCLVLTGVGVAILLFALLSTVSSLHPAMLYGIGSFAFLSFFCGLLILLKNE